MCKATAKIIAACSFKAIVGGACSYNCPDQRKSLKEVLLLSFVKDIERHKSLWSFTGVTGEQELILLRAGIFTTQQGVSDLTICPFHRSDFGTVEFQTRLHIPGKGNKKSVKGDRGVFSPCTHYTHDQ